MKYSIFWFRRDLRLNDNAALYHALKSGLTVIPIFIFDKNILNELEDRSDKRVQFIYQTIENIKLELQKINSDLKIFYDTPQQAFEKIIAEFKIKKVFTNHDYEPYAINRDAEIKLFLESKNISFHTFKDQVIFEKNEVLKDDGKPYTVFTPFSKKWKAALTDFHLKSYPTEKYFSNFAKLNPEKLISENEMNFTFQPLKFPLSNFPKKIIADYHNTRDFPAIEGISRLSLHLRFGTISIRELVRYSKSVNEKYLNELIWREFYMTIIWHFPYVVNSCFKKEYNYIKWRNNEVEFDAWCNGKTGYPIVDAGMKELNETGFMHNRVRMIVASFLTKHLLIDWRWGEAYFAKKLLDFELSSNNGGWQWAAGCGVDAAPYFRVFNPALQTERFDKDLKYINKWLPELNSFDYPKPIVEHKFARERVLKVYAETLKA
ncbi:MAG: hypothetical protein RL708_898 [Bacteroidota bacterium]|jgi:deoxyribodipyrimidine photo-lyase